MKEHPWLVLLVGIFLGETAACVAYHLGEQSLATATTKTSSNERWYEAWHRCVAQGDRSYPVLEKE